MPLSDCDMNKILVVNMNYLGDALMTTPALSALRLAHPYAIIDAIAGSQPGYGAYDILSRNPDIDHLIPRVQGGFLKRFWQVWSTLSRGRYDAVVILPPIRLYEFAAMLAMTPRRSLAKRVAADRHMSDAMLDAVRPYIDRPDEPHALVLAVSDQDRERAKGLLGPVRDRRPLIGFNLGASRPQKRWPTESFIQVVRRELSSGRGVVLLGGGSAADRLAASAIREGIQGDGLVDLTGKTSVRELSGVIEACDVIVTVDTGAMHMAAAVGTPLVAIFGSTDPVVVGPYGPTPARVLNKRLPCSPCNNHPTCGGRFMCMSDVTPAEVSQAVEELLAAPNPVRAAKGAG
ncbi:MAG: glycosyltransferase family 9 protein [Capsulimonadaceae bacterium]|nr:glycosyltransferase family 9 protein [Capsulimonadaceae bacterium]